MTHEECSTRTGRRNHFRTPGAAVTFCGQKAIDKIQDQRHRSDAICYRCSVKREGLAK